MKLAIIKSIQYHFEELTNSRISQFEVNKFILPIIEFINDNRFNKFLLAGSQGVGKTTLLKIIKIVLEKYFNKKILSLALDDFYLDKKERDKLAKSFHPLLNTRGVPGTHNINFLLKIVAKFDKSQYPLQLPIFDKLRDTRKKTKKIIKHKCDILILEGWCVGCPPITNKYLLSNINSLEDKFDRSRNWRIYYNNYLKKHYSILFKQFDSLIFFKVPSFSHVYKWRLKQENQLRKKNKYKRSFGMSGKEIANFIQYYEKISKWMLKKIPNKADLVLYVNKKQRITRIRKN